jgi:uncharacterized membrane protein (TIGR02234 family)
VGGVAAAVGGVAVIRRPGPAPHDDAVGRVVVDRPDSVRRAAAGRCGRGPGGWPLRLLAVLVAAVSAGAAYLAISLWTTRDVAGRAAHLVDVPVTSLVGSSRQYWGAVATLVAAVATLLAAVLLMRAAVKGSARLQKYASPSQRRAAAVGGDSSATMSERMMWDALDEGDDPTRDSASEGR